MWVRNLLNGTPNGYTDTPRLHAVSFQHCTVTNLPSEHSCVVPHPRNERHTWKIEEDGLDAGGKSWMLPVGVDPLDTIRHDQTFTTEMCSDRDEKKRIKEQRRNKSATRVHQDEHNQPASGSHVNVV